MTEGGLTEESTHEVVRGWCGPDHECFFSCLTAEYIMLSLRPLPTRSMKTGGILAAILKKYIMTYMEWNGFDIFGPLVLRLFFFFFFSCLRHNMEFRPERKEDWRVKFVCWLSLSWTASLLLFTELIRWIFQAFVLQAPVLWQNLFEDL